MSKHAGLFDTMQEQVLYVDSRTFHVSSQDHI